MTEKLYYSDVYLSVFSADVISVEQKGNCFSVVLDKTAFFPEEGGQSSDKGYIADARVLDVKEEDGIVYHYTDKVPSTLKNASCKLNFAERFEKMQLHTAEHIVCGIMHKLYGYENVGFHLGADIVTFDINAELTREVLDKVEALANEAVFKNLEVTQSFYTASELQNMEYRSKLEVFDGMRIVRIGDVDSCACCAPHVSKTGEIGVIKLLDYEKHRGGTRIVLLAGHRAYRDYSDRYRIIKRISGLLSEPQSSVDEAVENLIRERDALRAENKKAELTLARALAYTVSNENRKTVYSIDAVSIDALREFCNIAGEKTGELVVAVSGAENEYKYVLYDKSRDISQLVKDANAELLGRGGGRGHMAQGTYRCPISKIRKYFD